MRQNAFIKSKLIVISLLVIVMSITVSCTKVATSVEVDASSNQSSSKALQLSFMGMNLVNRKRLSDLQSKILSIRIKNQPQMRKHLRLVF